MHDNVKEPPSGTEVFAGGVIMKGGPVHGFQNSYSVKETMMITCNVNYF